MKELLKLGKRLSKSEQQKVRGGSGGCYVICYFECDDGGPLNNNNNNIGNCTQTCEEVC